MQGLNSLPDNVLMMRVQGDQPDCLGLLYERYKDPLFSFFVHMTQDGFRSQDLVQTVFVRILKYRRQFKGDGTFKAWMYSIARNVLADSYRKRSRLRERAVDEQAANEASSEQIVSDMETSERYRHLHEAIAKLPRDKREALVLIKLHEMKYRDVAEILQIKESTLKVKVFRAIRDLKGIMAQDKSFYRYE